MIQYWILDVVLEIFVEFLKIRKIKFKNYLGIDLNKEIL